MLGTEIQKKQNLPKYRHFPQNILNSKVGRVGGGVVCCLLYNPGLIPWNCRAFYIKTNSSCTQKIKRHLIVISMQSRSKPTGMIYFQYVYAACNSRIHANIPQAVLSADSPRSVWRFLDHSASTVLGLSRYRNEYGLTLELCTGPGCSWAIQRPCVYCSCWAGITSTQCTLTASFPVISNPPWMLLICTHAVTTPD